MPPRTGMNKPRKPRPSRARGLRTTTGCLTCRKRRVKCDEGKPRCRQCTKSERGCVYGQSTDVTATAALSEQDTPQQSTSPAQATASVVAESPTTRKSIAGDIDPQLFVDSPELRFDLSPLTLTTSLPSPNSAPFEWYDLLAEDAINNIQKHNLGFDQMCLSRRQSPVPDEHNFDPRLQSPERETFVQEPWRSPEAIPLNDDQLSLFQHFVSSVGPILDLFDPLKQFSNAVPRLAINNVGLLRSLLAVAARHLALHSDAQQSSINVQTPGSNISESGLHSPLLEAATQYYYETLHYLSQNLLYPSYTKSSEIISTAILISTYEMFDSSGRYSDGGWERHLRGIFWIQRSQDNNGESKDGLRRGAWWTWLRQDIWVAFRESRRTLTIWRPTKRLVDLTPDELATRIVYICARCVDFAANEKHYDLSIRIDQGDKLLQALDDWYHILPPSFQPIYSLPMAESGLFAPIWIHPPSYAAAIQMFHFARIVVLINQPSLGGMHAFRQRQRFLDESVETICGIAIMHVHQGRDSPSAFANYQALYAAGLCVQTPVKQSAILQLLEKTLNVTKFPPKTLLDDLASYWRAES
ncbi:hypothetical protein K458DRAFT_323648 [Lentithecium fluviatile CBS 122367]|uniref:Zn(2)-C6 fungal-type domain-containing protein n=1 Tax=Lentithecium fluviatile CBS 122367 TaxID=1168545 RepID=A0A6G1ICH6_9PLEO|nr:hypothetical protein K458DRAFT_323648 [Lentithecium fluviatile CBS 122367]